MMWELFLHAVSPPETEFPDCGKGMIIHMREKNGLLFDRYRKSLESMTDAEQNTTQRSVESIQFESEEAVLHAFKSMDWSFSEEDTAYLSHDIHPYPAKFPPQLPAQIIKLLSSSGEKIWDPFGGSGTTALEALLNDRSCVSTDINPIGSIVGKAKTTALCSADEAELNRLMERLEYCIGNLSCLGGYFEEYKGELEKEIPDIPNIEKWFAPAMICELALTRYADGDYSAAFDQEAMEEICSWFPKRVISKMGFILSKISSVPDERMRQFLKVILSSIIRESSQQEPSDLRIRRRKEPITDAPVIEWFANNLDRQYQNIMGFYQIRNQAPEALGEAHIWRGNSTLFGGVSEHLPAGGVDIVISSPPYATALPYIDTNRLNMLVLDGYNASKRIPIEAEMTGTREIGKSVRGMYEEKIRAGEYGGISSETARQIIQKVFRQNDSAEVGFRKKNMAALLYMYFRDLSAVLNTIHAAVKKEGYVCLVIGDTKTTTGEEKVMIQTTQMLRETAGNMGWKLLGDIPISVTKENYLHMNHSITENNILIFQK